VTDFQLPAYLQSRAPRGVVAQLQKSLPTGQVPSLSIKGGAFTLVDGAGNERKVGALDDKLGIYVDVCIIDSNPHVSKVYYARAFDPNAEAFVPPDCFSDNGIAPSANALSPQHKDCKTCPHNEWGTATTFTGKRGKECDDKQKIAVVIPGMEMAFLLAVPPASLKHLAKYVKEVGSFSAGSPARQVDITDLITRVYFQPGAVGVLGFTAVGFVDANTVAIADRLYETKATDLLVGRNDQPYTGEIGVLAAGKPTLGHALPPPAPAGELRQAELRQALQQSVAQESTQAEPQKRRGRPKKEEPDQASPPSAFVPQNGQEQPVPPFLKREAELPAAKPTPAFGMQAATAAPDDMQARIAAVLAMKTGG
jgi:hypothetical protein